MNFWRPRTEPWILPRPECDLLKAKMLYSIPLYEPIRGLVGLHTPDETIIEKLTRKLRTSRHKTKFEKLLRRKCKRKSRWQKQALRLVNRILAE